MLETQSLNVEIGDVKICHGLDLKLTQGQCWAMMGKNGAGKTTLLHTLSGLRSPLSGQVLLDNQSLSGLSRKTIACRVGLLPQDFHDPFPSTVLETALIGRHPHLSAWHWETADDTNFAMSALERMGMATFSHRTVNSLSGGERRRLGMATVLVQDPRLFLLDEPVNHLDLNHQHTLLATIQSEVHERDRCAMMSLHDPNLVWRYCDRVVMLMDNAEVLQGKTHDMLTEENLHRLYDYPIKRIEYDSQVVFVAD